MKNPSIEIEIMKIHIYFRNDRGQYLRGTEVKLKIKSLEMSERFLGHKTDISLLEADCVLLGLNK